MNLSGSIADWTVPELLNMLRVTSKTATMHISGDRSGQVHFKDGRVSGAVITGEVVVEGEAGSKLSTVDSLFVLSGLESGNFEMRDYAGPDVDGWDVDELVAEMTRLQGLEEDVEKSGLVDTRIILRDEIDTAVSISPDDWWAVASLVSVISLDQLESVFGRARAVRLLHTLWRLGLVETLDEDEPGPDAIAEAPPVVRTQTPESPLDKVEAEGPGDESWLDEIAGEEEANASALEVSIDRKPLTGVAAPASTVLTGSVLDEMRRLRGRAPE